MADTANNSIYLDYLSTRGAQVAYALFNGVESGPDLAQNVREALARIPDLDDRDDRTRWSWDSLNEELLNDPGDIKQADIANLQRITEEYFAEAQSPEEMETLARLFIFALGDENTAIPDGESALNYLETVAFKHMLADSLSSVNQNGRRTFPEDLSYPVDAENLFDPASEDFIQAYGEVLAQIQADMQQFGLNGLPRPANGERYYNDEDIMGDDLRAQAINAFVETLPDNNTTAHIATLEGEEQFYTLQTYLTNLPNTNPDKASYLETLDKLNDNVTPQERLNVLYEFGVITHSPENRIFQENFLTLQNIERAGLDSRGIIGPEMQAFLPAYIDMISNFDSAEGQRAIALGQLQTAFEALSDDVQTSINTALENNAGTPPGILTRPETDEDTPDNEQGEQPPPPEAIYRQSVLENAAEAMNIPATVLNDIENTTELSGVPYAHFDEGFERSMRAIFAENFVDMYGRPHPTSDDLRDRIGGDESLWRYWEAPEGYEEHMQAYFELNAEHPLIQDIAAQTDDPSQRFLLLSEGVNDLGTDDPLINSYGALFHNIRAGTFEYHIQPGTGEITKYRVGADNELYTTISPDDNRPLVMDSEYPDFDFFHPNEITREFLERQMEREWELQFTEHAPFYEARGIDITQQPSVEDIDTVLLPDLEQRVLNSLRALHQNMQDEELQALKEELLEGEFTHAQLMQRLNPQSGSEDVVLQVHSYLVLMDQIEAMRDLTALSDYANYATTGLLPNGSVVNPLALVQPWGQSAVNNPPEGEFRWEFATEGRPLTPELYAAYDRAIDTGAPINAQLFAHDEFAMSYMRDRGWLDENDAGQLDYIQTSMVTRELMIRDAADRHGIEPPDGANPEARAAFVEDYRNGYYNLIDIDIMMRSFDADGEHHAAFRAEHEARATSPGALDHAADVRHRSALFNDMFGQDIELENPEGANIVVNSTISQEDAVLMFWRDYRAREAFGYNETRYGWDYERMLEEHGNQHVNFNGQSMTFPEVIQYYMENHSLYQMNMLRDVNNPIGDFHTRQIRRYQAAYAQEEEISYKARHEVVSLPEPSSTLPRLNPEHDVITPMPEPAVEEQEARASPTPEELLENCQDMTQPTSKCAAIIAGGGVTPDVAPAPTQAP
ncbi:MAG: hypothetical protein ACLFR0_06655 [Alphaproteobacteria bacterium]